ncbi:DASH family cryptochrome [Chromobacterium phragmitis]|uniref:DASH family cryptochrome n=1 Tax=Chromobacterium amazonense TaxID=1382803 RepID=UPI0021B6FF6E|nr:DASH family cryptochrome [Chromobacterium amazonense]MBM2885429.1 DASH family cryptochrome [Chromobacterium amazonense]
MSATLYWLRQDLRLDDNLALLAACGCASLLPVYCHYPTRDSGWDCPRLGRHRAAFLGQALDSLAAALRDRGSALCELQGPPEIVLPALARQVGADLVVCERIAAPEEEAEVLALRQAGLQVSEIWQSSLYLPEQLPFAIERLPAVFTDFRRALEQAGPQPLPPQNAPTALPPLPAGWTPREPPPRTPPAIEARSSFPYHLPACHGGETAARAHFQQYLARGLPHRYKATRDRLYGVDFSSKLSPWLASGALSPRRAWQMLKAFEARHGASEGSGWIGFELLWRDYFRFLHLRHRARLYHAAGLSSLPSPAHDAAAFQRWRKGETGQPLVDAAMRELSASGYLSNRLRQVAASYLIYECGGDWRAGAAWFESQLIDYDAYSNQGNWLYIAGRGTDPRGGRRFNPERQAAEHDAQGRYRALWSTA